MRFYVALQFAQQKKYQLVAFRPTIAVFTKYIESKITGYQYKIILMHIQ